MPISQTEHCLEQRTPAVKDRIAIPAEAAELLQQVFGVSFIFVDGNSADVLDTLADSPQRDTLLYAALCREVASRNQPELIAEEDPFLVLAIPLVLPAGESRVAIAPFLGRQISPHEEISPAAAAAVGLSPSEAAAWAARQTPWPAEALRRTAALALAHWNARRRVNSLEAETGSLSKQIASTYEEITLLYRLTQNLRISESDEALGRLALEWLEEALPASGLALQYLPAAQEGQSPSHGARRQSVLLARGRTAVDDDAFTRLIEHLSPRANGQPVVVNRPRSEQPDWPCAEVRQLIVVPLAEGKNLFGWLAALNHVDDGEFGTVEASLLGSVAAILGIHGGNLALYRQQAELMAGIVRALTAAIDAKDQYTCGHSDRVARIAVRLAEQLGCDQQALTTIYLSGLLHDIGKIGVQDSVLRKPGKLSDEEYEHIKQHTEIGHKILRDLKKLGNVLSVILHHHESWDGAGYPRQLRAEEIPLEARIVAVADSYDAMGSNRPYRQGMPDEKIDAIFRAGAGQQWDARVVEAFFAARDDLRRIVNAASDDVKIDLQGWR